jgi:hypothetical protein
MKPLDIFKNIIRSASFWIIVSNSFLNLDILRHLSAIMMIYGTRVILNPRFFPQVPWSIMITAHIVFHWAVPILAGWTPPPSPPLARHIVVMAVLSYMYTRVNPDFYKIPYIQEELLLTILMYYFLMYHFHFLMYFRSISIE